MNQARFAQLIEGFCKDCGLDEPERILQGIVARLIHISLQGRGPFFA